MFVLEKLKFILDYLIEISQKFELIIPGLIF